MRLPVPIAEAGLSVGRDSDRFSLDALVQRADEIYFVFIYRAHLSSVYWSLDRQQSTTPTHNGKP